jgi:hypothetical protein
MGAEKTGAKSLMSKTSKRKRADEESPVPSVAVRVRVKCSTASRSRGLTVEMMPAEEMENTPSSFPFVML